MITETDSSEVFDTTQMPDGAYILEVIVHDCAGNESTAQMPIIINNAVGVKSGQLGDPQSDNYTLSFFPNPANPSTVVSFLLPGPENVNLSIYNLHGQLITTLINGMIHSGLHSIHWDASNEAAGIYLARLSTNQAHTLMKIIVLK